VLCSAVLDMSKVYSLNSTNVWNYFLTYRLKIEIILKQAAQNFKPFYLNILLNIAMLIFAKKIRLQALNHMLKLFIRIRKK
jgi:hypothetical protein